MRKTNGKLLSIILLVVVAVAGYTVGEQRVDCNCYCYWNEEVDDVGNRKSLFDDFETYDAGDLLTDATNKVREYTTSIPASTTITVESFAGGKAMFLDDNNVAARCYAAGTLPTVQQIEPTDSRIHVKLNQNTANTEGWVLSILDENDTIATISTHSIYLGMDSGNLRTYNGAAWVDTGADITQGTTHDIIIEPVTSSTHNIYVDGVLYQNGGVPFTNRNAFTGNLKWIILSTNTNDQAELYIDDIFVEETEGDLQVYRFEYSVDSENDKKPQNTHLVVETTTDTLYMVDGSDDTQILKTTDGGATWTALTLTTPASTYGIEHFYHDKTNGYLYYGSVRDNPPSVIVYNSYIDLSDDSDNLVTGVTLTGTDGFFYDLIGDGTYIWRMNSYEDGTYQVNIIFNRAGASYAFTIETTVSDPTGTYVFSRSVNVGSYLYFVYADSGGNGELWRWEIGVAGSSGYKKMDDIGATLDIPDNTNLNSIAYDGIGTLYFVLKDTGDSNNYLYSYALSNDASAPNTGASDRIGPFDVALMLDRNVAGTAPNLQEKGFKIAGTTVHEIKSTTVGTRRLQDISTTVDFTTGATIIAITDNWIFVEQSGGTVELWEYTNRSDLIKSTSGKGLGVIQTADSTASEMSFMTSPTGATFFNAGDIIEIFDQYDVLEFKGRVIKPKNRTNRSLYRVDLTGLDGLDFPKKIEKNYPDPFSGSAVATDTIIKDQLDDEKIDWLYYTPESIDDEDDYTLTYKIRLQLPFGGQGVNDVLRFTRELERAIAYVAPDGLVYHHYYTRAVATGYRWNENNDGKLRILSEYSEVTGITNSEVTAGSNTKGQIYVDYPRSTDTADFATSEQRRLEDGGKTITKYSNQQLTNYTESRQLALNRFKFYEGPVQVVQLRAEGFGFVQVGETVDFSWDDNRANISRRTMYVMAVDRDSLDNSTEIWLLDAPISVAELNGVIQNLGEDSNMRSTDVDRTGDESTSDGTALRQNSLSTMRSGPIVWLGYGGNTSEPTQPHFTEDGAGTSTDLSLLILVVDTWYDLDLSSIVPPEARAVYFKIDAVDNLIGTEVSLRRNGQAGTQQTADRVIALTNRVDTVYRWVGVDDDQVCEILTTVLPGSWTALELTVMAYSV
jgi:hypothetical protein